MLVELLVSMLIGTGNSQEQIDHSTKGSGNPGASVNTIETIYNIDVDKLQKSNQSVTVVGLPESL